MNAWLHTRAPVGALLRGLLLCGGLLVSAATFAAPPAAGTVIQNQAAASYEPCLDAACAAAAPLETVTSNLVETVVQQVAALSLTNDQTRPIALGGLALLPHQLVNLGNGPDRYELCILDVDPDIGTFAVFADADGDGQPDSTTPLFDETDPDGCADTLTPSLAPGVAYDFVIEVGVSASASAGARPSLDIRARSDFDNGVTDLNTDTVEVVAGPVIEIVKRLGVSTGPAPAGPIRVTLEYRNTGLADATALIIEDVLPLTTASGGAGAMRHVAGSGRWSVTGATVLTDADDGDQGTTPDFIDYCAYDTIGTCADRVRIQLASVPAGASGEVTFDVDIDAGIADAERLLNDVSFSYSDAGGGTQFGDPVPFRSNAVAYVVNAVSVNPGVIANASRTDGTVGADDALDTDNVVTVASINQGERVQFEDVVWNAGDGSDLFDVTIDAVNDRLGAPLASPFPSGTLFRLLRADGLTPLSDTDVSGIPDTGTLPKPVGGSCGAGLLLDISADRCGIAVVVEAILPASLMAADVPVGGYEVTLRARSAAAPMISNAVTNRLLAVSDSAVDLTNERAPDGSAPGEGAGPEGAPVTTEVVAAGATAVFTLVATNTGSVTDAFTFAVSDDLDFANAAFASNPEVSVRFGAAGPGGDCTTPGADSAGSGPLAPGASFFVCAEIFTPADAVGGTQIDLYFRSRSETTGAQDVKFDRVAIAAGPAIDAISNESGQVEPGSSFTYTHQVTNVGNVDLDSVVFATAPAPEDDGGWSVVLYLDLDDDGVRGPGDPFIEPDVPFAAAPFDVFAVGETVRFFAVVFAPATAAFGERNIKTITVTATPVGGGVDVSDQVVDNTTAVAGGMRVLKEQALDADCDGTPDGPGACSGEACYRVSTFQVIPAQECVVYRLTATNTSTETAFNVRINDTTQPFTNYLAAAERCERPSGNCDADVTAPSDGGTGDVIAAIGELAAGAFARLYFGLRVE